VIAFRDREAAGHSNLDVPVRVPVRSRPESHGVDMCRFVFGPTKRSEPRTATVSCSPTFCAPIRGSA